MPPMMPINVDVYTFDASHDAVMDTRPASNPFVNLHRSSFLSSNMPNRKEERPPHAAEMVVLKHTFCVRCYLSPDMPKVEPPLKPYQPNHRINVPSVTIPALCGLNSLWSVSGSNRPNRGPRNRQPISPHTPPNMCTTPEPAKSR